MIETISKDFVKNKRSRKDGRRVLRYRDAYWNAIEPHVSFLKEKIHEQGTVLIGVDEMKKALGPDFVDKDWTTVFTGMKYVLFHHDIILRSTTHKDGSKIFSFRARVNGDVLSGSLAHLDNKLAE